MLALAGEENLAMILPEDKIVEYRHLPLPQGLLAHVTDYRRCMLNICKDIGALVKAPGSGEEAQTILEELALLISHLIENHAILAERIDRETKNTNMGLNTKARPSLSKITELEKSNQSLRNEPIETRAELADARDVHAQFIKMTEKLIDEVAMLKELFIQFKNEKTEDKAGSSKEQVAQLVNKKSEDEAASSNPVTEISKEKDVTINPAVVNQGFFATKRDEDDADSKDQNSDNLNKNPATKN